MQKYYWMRVTKDKYELPLAVGDTAEELAKLVGVKVATIKRAICRSNECKNQVFFKIPREPDDIRR